MMLDAATLLVVLVFVSALLSALLALSWLQNRAVAALAWWSGSFALGTFGIALLAARGRIPDVLSIDIANAATLLGYGLAWNSSRLFDERRGSLWLAAAGALVWLIACRVPAFYDSFFQRVALASMLVAGYAMAAAWELWRGDRQLPTRRFTALVLAAHGLFLLGRAPMLLLTSENPRPEGLATFAGPLTSALIFETLVFTISTAFLLLSTAKEQLEVEHRRAAFDDPLTGLANRRGFIAGAEKAVEQARQSGRPAALLVLDLDFFKAVNDTYGHQVGDRVLRRFATVVTARLRANDLMARIGGEEFAAVLPDTSLEGGLEVAERIRAVVAGMRVPVQGEAISVISVTVSIGVASSWGKETLDAVLSSADTALYRAKAAGRNRVKAAEAGPSSIRAALWHPGEDRLSA